MKKINPEQAALKFVEKAVNYDGTRKFMGYVQVNDGFMYTTEGHVVHVAPAPPETADGNYEIATFIKRKEKRLIPFDGEFTHSSNLKEHMEKLIGKLLEKTHKVWKSKTYLDAVLYEIYNNGVFLNSEYVKDIIGSKKGGAWTMRFTADKNGKPDALKEVYFENGDFQAVVMPIMTMK